MSASFSGFGSDRVPQTRENESDAQVDERDLMHVDDAVAANATDEAIATARQRYVRLLNKSLACALPYVDSDELMILCECGDHGCDEWVTVSIRAYRAVRSEASCYILAPGHEVPALLDRVRERHAAYTVVDQGRATPIAAQEDLEEPRDAA